MEKDGQKLRLRSLKKLFEQKLKDEAPSTEPPTKVSFATMKPRVLVDTSIKKTIKVPPKKKKEVPVEPLKDAILFRNSGDYEKYLFDRLEKYGLDQELYEQFKVLFVSAGNLGALNEVWNELHEMGLSESEIWLEKADIFRQMGQMEQALVFLEKNVRAFPKDPHANFAMAMYYKLERNYEVALHWLKKWERLDSLNPEVHYHLGAVYRRIQSTDLSRRHLNECLRLDRHHLMAKSLVDKLDQSL